jgi:hypothetical protein
MKQNKISMWRMPALLLALGGALIFGGCSSPSGSDDASKDVVVNALELTNLVAAPVKGEAPNIATISTVQYTGDIAWGKEDGSNFSGNFAASTVYQAVVTLTANSGFTFKDVAANSFSHARATVTNAANSGTVTIVFPATEALSPISDLTATAGDKLVTLAWTDPEEADLGSIEISWTSTLGDDDVKVSKGKLTYTAQGLSNETVYTFTLKAVDTAGNKSDGVSVRVIPVAPELVSVLDLTKLVTRPKQGAQPVTTEIDTPQYTGTVAWQTQDGAAHSGVFAASTEYQAVVALTAKAGFSFSGVAANSFRYAGATVTNEAGSGTTITVTITFPATKKADISIENPSVKIFCDDDDDPLDHNGTTTVDSEPGIITVSIDPSYASVVWYLNGTKVTTANGISLALPKRTAGIYQITVEAEAPGGAQHSGAHTFVIE